MDQQGLLEPLLNRTKIDFENETYCYDPSREVYTWCVDESLYAVPLGIIVLLSFFYGSISVVALGGNGLVIYIVVFTRRMQNVTNIYIANLAFADVIIALFCIPFQFYAALLQRWDLPQFMCQFCPFVQILSVNVSIFTMVAISLDRYRAIMTPLRDKPTKFIAKIVIFFIWLIGVLMALPMGFFHHFVHVFDPNNGGMKPFCTTEHSNNSKMRALIEPDEFTPALNESFGNATEGGLLSGLPSILNLGLFEFYSLILLIIQYVIPLAVISYVYIKMGIKLWMNRTPGSAQDKRDQTILLNKKRIIKMLIIVVCIFGICWLPWHLFYLCTLFAPSMLEYHYINIIFFICHWFAMSNSCYNPFIYGIYSEKFKREFRESTRCGRQNSNRILNNGRGGFGGLAQGSPTESGLEQIRLFQRGGHRDLPDIIGTVDAVPNDESNFHQLPKRSQKSQNHVSLIHSRTNDKGSNKAVPTIYRSYRRPYNNDF